MSRFPLFLAGLAALLLAAPALVAQNAGPTDQARLKVTVPADAKLQIGDRMTRSTGPVREFITPPLPVDAKKKYTYELKATFTDKDGKTKTITKSVQVTPGQTTEVDLTKEEPAVKPKTNTKPKVDTKPKTDDKPKTNDKPKTDTKPKTDDKPKTDTKPEDNPKRPLDVIFVPSAPEVVDEMLKLADVKKTDVLYDLGCGDGIIVVTAAKKYGCKAVGYDLDPERVKEAKERVKKAGVENLVTIEQQDIFKLDLNGATVIATYLLENLNKRLVPQLSKMKPGTRVVTNDYPIPGYKPDKQTKVDVKGRDYKVWLYTIPLHKEADSKGQ